MTSFLPADFEVLNLKFGGKQLARDYVAGAVGARGPGGGGAGTRAHGGFSSARMRISIVILHTWPHKCRTIREFKRQRRLTVLFSF